MDFLLEKSTPISDARHFRRWVSATHESAGTYIHKCGYQPALGIRFPTMCGSFLSRGTRSTSEAAQFARQLQKNLKHPNRTNELATRNKTSSAITRPAKRRPRNDTCVFSDAQLEIIDICVRGAGAFGVSRSVGEIFGLLLCSPRPVNFDDVVQSLGISSGSASHGLRGLCRLGIIRSCYVARDRRVHYVLETSLRSLVVALLEENLLVHLTLADQQIQRLRARLNDDSGAGRFLIPQVELLASWNAQFRAALKPMLEALG